MSRPNPLVDRSFEFAIINFKSKLANGYASSARHCSSGRAPQKLHDSPSPLMSGLLEAHVPSNFPSFFAQILIAIPAKPNPNNKMLNNANFMIDNFVQN